MIVTFLFINLNSFLIIIKGILIHVHYKLRKQFLKDSHYFPLSFVCWYLICETSHKILHQVRLLQYKLQFINHLMTLKISYTIY